MPIAEFRKMSIILFMSHDMEPPHGFSPMLRQAGEAAWEYVQSLPIGMDIAARLRQAEPALDDNVVRRVAGFAAREVIVLRQGDQDVRRVRTEALQQDHADAVGLSRQRAAFEGEGDEHFTGALQTAEWSAITILAQTYTRRRSDRTGIDLALPLLMTASEIEMKHPGN